jgi:hypothetical protein
LLTEIAVNRINWEAEQEGNANDEERTEVEEEA